MFLVDNWATSPADVTTFVELHPTKNSISTLVMNI